MKKVLIQRDKPTVQGTFGKLSVDDGWSCITGELPWKDNAPDFSCIPAGVYVCKFIDSPKHGGCYEVTGVKDRSNIEIHSANYCGDKTEGFLSDLLGCIALGQNVGILGAQRAVLDSRVTVLEFNSHMGGQDFELEIRDAQE